MRKLSMVAVVLAVMVAASARTGSAQDAVDDRRDALAVVHKVAEQWSLNQTPSRSLFDASFIIIDDSSPYVFEGPNALEDWKKAYFAYEPVGAEDSTSELALMDPTDAESKGRRHAYFVIPALWTVRTEDKTIMSKGTITVTLRKRPEGWLITAWVWSPRQ